MNISTLRQRIQTLSLTLKCLRATDQHKTIHESSRQTAQEQSFVKSYNTTNSSNSVGEKNEAKRQRLVQTSPLFSGPSLLKSVNSTLTKEDFQEKSLEYNSRIIENQQKRLILLRHASKCNEKYCTVKDCNLMVTLWNHMKACDDKDCKVHHCLRSKCILNHYRICKDTCDSTSCKVCAPVRKAGEYVLTSNEKSQSDPLCSLAEIESLPFIDSKVFEPLSLERGEGGLNKQNLSLDCISGMTDLQDIIVPHTNKKPRENDSSSSFYPWGGTIHRNVIFPQSSFGSSDCRGYDGDYYFSGDATSESKSSLGDTVVDDDRHMKVEKNCNKMISDMMLPIVFDLINHEFGWVFKDPVDPVELCLPDYFQVVSEPMDLNSIKERLLKMDYSDVGECSRDIQKVFENAILYNGKDSDVGTIALQMLDAFTIALQN